MTPSSHALALLREVAVPAVSEALEALAAGSARGEAPLSTAGRDIKLQADLVAERTIIDRLTRATAFDLLSEEAGLVQGSAGRRIRWIVDPLDGTYNYYRQLPCWGISVALWADGEPLLGVVADGPRGDVYTGLVGTGAWCNGVPIAVSTVTRAADAVICTGFPLAMELTDARMAGWGSRVRRFKKTRLLGSAAVSLAMVAAGRADAYVEEDIRLWDVAAGVALVRAAGGTARLDPRPGPYTLNVAAWNGRLEWA